MDSFAIYTDGGARGNPGPAAIGIIINGTGYSEYIGKATNNVAEYTAVLFALKKTAELAGKNMQKATLTIHTDSELVARQMMGLYKIKQPHLKELHTEATRLAQSFAAVHFTVIRREKNQEADALVNKCLDKQAYYDIQ